MTCDNTSDVVNVSTNEMHSDTLSVRLPEVAAALQQACIFRVRVEYHSWQGIGFVDDPRYCTSNWRLARPQLPAATREALLAFFKELLELRYSGWANAQGVCGAFEWYVVSDTLIHTHTVWFNHYDFDRKIVRGL